MHKRLGGAKSEAEKTSLSRLVAATDAEIDKLVYELYDLTAEEIAIAEEGDRTDRTNRTNKVKP